MLCVVSSTVVQICSVWYNVYTDVSLTKHENVTKMRKNLHIKKNFFLNAHRKKPRTSWTRGGCVAPFHYSFTFVALLLNLKVDCGLLNIRDNYKKTEKTSILKCRMLFINSVDVKQLNEKRQGWLSVPHSANDNLVFGWCLNYSSLLLAARNFDTPFFAAIINRGNIV